MRTQRHTVSKASQLELEWRYTQGRKMCLMPDQAYFPPCILSSLSDFISQECSEFRVKSVEQVPPEKPAALTYREETLVIHYTNEPSEPPIGGSLSVPQQSHKYTGDEEIVEYGG